MATDQNDTLVTDEERQEIEKLRSEQKLRNVSRYRFKNMSTRLVLLLFLGTLAYSIYIRPETRKEVEPAPDVFNPPETRVDADKLFKQGHFERAIQAYESFSGEQQEFAPDALKYRKALSVEALGRLDLALDKYQAIVDEDGSASIRGAARVGMARVYLRKGIYDQAIAIARTVVSEGLQPSLRGEPFLVDAVYLLGIALSQQASAKVSLGSLERPNVENSPMHWSMDEALAWAEVREPGQADSAASELVSVAVNNLDTPVALLDQAIAKAATHPLANAGRIELGNLRFHAQVYANAVNRYREAGNDPSLGTTAVAKFNLGVAYKWLGESELAIKAFEDVGDSAPAHRLAAHAFLLVGRELLNAGKFNEAVNPLSRAATSRGNDSVSVAASVYAGIAYLMMSSPQLGNPQDFRMLTTVLRESRDAFSFGVSDQLHTLETERQAVDEAYKQAEDDEVKQQKAERFAAIEKEMDGLTQQLKYLNAAAFINSYARFLTMQSTAERRREGEHVLNGILALGDDLDWMGTAGILLIGKAYRHLGLESEMVAVYEKHIGQAALNELTAEMTLLTAIANYHTAKRSRDHAEVESAFRQFDRIGAQNVNRWSLRALQEMARLGLEDVGTTKYTLHACRAMLKLDLLDDQQKEALKWMGRAYETRKEYDKAILAFAGKISELQKPQPEKP
ncbi:MAG: tetratricopeptide repeat protein [Planctomycetota bacterium]|nr:tetratricopeptide repeat protein [Planctomycetota bacterium]